MKRFTLLLFAAILAFSSCENIEGNSPALQGEIDSIFFKALEVRGELNDDGSVTLQGINRNEIMTVHTEAGLVGSYELGAGSPNWARYESPDGDEYTTAPFGTGRVEITDRCISSSCGSLTGNFWFTAKRSENDTLPINVQKGVFFEVSFLSGNVETGLPAVGTVEANIDGVPFEASVVTVDEDGVSITIDGLLGTQSIKIQVPSNSVSGNYFLPRTGFSASYTNNGVTTEAEDGGIVSVNFNNQETRKILIFFNFEAAGKVITSGEARAEY